MPQTFSLEYELSLRECQTEKMRIGSAQRRESGVRKRMNANNINYLV